MSNLFRELLRVFWKACKETPRGMFAPFRAFWKVAIHNPVLDHETSNHHHCGNGGVKHA